MKILVTSALPYANGDIHLGHLAGAYLPADIYTRYFRMKGADIIHISGTDEHGVPITLKAKQEGVSPQQIVDRYHNIIKESFKGINISFDNFSRTSLSLHHKLSQEFFKRIYSKGLIEKREIKQFYCKQCKMFLADRYVEGTCPHCGNENARGDQCEACGRWIEPTLLKQPRCKICGSTPEITSTIHYFFKLNELEPSIKKWLQTKPNWKENVLRFSHGWLKEGLRPRAITRDLSWGVKVPLEEAKNKVLYVWFDAPIGYISSTMEWAQKKGEPDKWKDYWLDPKTKLVHFIGKDNIVFHAIVWPAMLMAYNEFMLPTDIPANEFLNLEGKPLSTSRNWAVWVGDYIKEFPADPLRYALAVNLPENRDIDFTWKDFQARNNNELADILGNFVNRVIVFIKKYLSGNISLNIQLKAEDEEILKKSKETLNNVAQYIETYEIKRAARCWMDLAGEANKYFDAQAPWKLRKENPERLNTVIYTLTKLVSFFGIVISPFIPESAEKINRMLGIKEKRSWDEGLNPYVPSHIEEQIILFKKIEDKTINKQIEKLKNPPKEDDRIDIEILKKVELVVAKVLEAEKVKGSSKLIKLLVSLGDEKRTIVAGIGKHYTPEELIGEKIIIVRNLKPAKLMGIESNGMLLAASNNETLTILKPDKDIPEGSKIS